MQNQKSFFIFTLLCSTLVGNCLGFFGGTVETGESSGYGLVSGAARVLEGVAGAILNVKAARPIERVERERETEVVVVNQAAPGYAPAQYVGGPQYVPIGQPQYVPVGQPQFVPVGQPVIYGK